MIGAAPKATLDAMNTPSDRQAYDPFGDPAIAQFDPTEAGDRRARNAALAVFWSISLLLLAGRAYQGDLHPRHQPHPMALASR